VEHTLRSDGLFYLKRSHARIFQSGLKTDGGVIMGDAHYNIVEVASSES
jgi:hypothetical protein